MHPMGVGPCLVLLLLLATTVVFSAKLKKQVDGPYEAASGDDGQSWAYVTVRPKAHMFYWLYETTHSKGYKNRPLILWLQGGPGGSSTGFGNFGELGPLDVNLKPRNTTWLQTASLLFIDNPVGTGYSYVEDKSLLTKDVAEISADLLVVMKAFMEKHPDFQTIPFYIFSESYGGKMTAAFSSVLYKSGQSGDIKVNFKGFAMGDSWISPVDSVNSWGPMLYATSNVDDAGLESIQKEAKTTESLVKQGKFAEATAAWDQTESALDVATGGINIYNILDWGGSEDLKFKSEHSDSAIGRLMQRHLNPLRAAPLDQLMNGPIRKKLKIIPDNVTWGGQSNDVFAAQSVDFMKNVTSTVNDLINSTPLTVVVYEGQLDVICATLGAEMWFDRLDIAPKFKDAERKLHPCKSHPRACYYDKYHKNVQFYWILDAGHMVPSDNGYGALEMVNKVIDG